VPIDRATKFFDDVIRANPRDAFGYSMRGVALIVDKHDIERAIADFDKAVQLDPNNAEAYLLVPTPSIATVGRLSSYPPRLVSSLSGRRVFASTRSRRPAPTRATSHRR
jgi:tetratricopeptide (TPR) repeat protein